MKTPKFYNDRAIAFANYIIEYNASTAETAEAFGCSASLVRNEIRDRLPKISPTLHAQIKKAYKANQAKGFANYTEAKKLNITTVIECECTNCRYNTAEYYKDKGLCGKGKITLRHKDIKTYSGDYTDVADCENYEYANKGKDFYKKV